MKKNTLLLLIAVLGIGIGAGIFFFLRSRTSQTSRSLKLISFVRDPEAHAEWVIQAGTICGDAPFRFPSDGMVGYLWGDHFRVGHTHQGIDIFAGTQAGVTPIFSAYDGYLTRLSDWVSTVIIRIPDDPLQPGRQIWTYYTHMADRDGNSLISDQFPPGAFEMFVPAGTLLGYQGDYSGDRGNPVWVHLHFSIIKDDGNGNYLNELKIENTLDPSPYLGLDLNAASSRSDLIQCQPAGDEKK